MNKLNFKKFYYLIFFTFNLLECNDGDLDITFNNPTSTLTNPVPGTLTTPNFGPTTDASSSNSLAIQTDQKIVAVGYATINISDSFVIARYNTDGSLDTTFGNTSPIPGTVATPSFTTLSSDTTFARASSVTIQTDGKIVVAGTVVTNPTGNESFAVARYNTDGSLDTTFGTSSPVPGTVVTTSFTTVPTDTNAATAASIAIQTDGKIVLVGSVNTNITGNDSFGIVRYNTDGSLDTTFGATSQVPGTVLTSYFTSVTSDTNSADALAIAIQSNGKIIVVGNSNTNPTGNDSFAIARYNTDGSLDTTFGATSQVPGTVLTSIFSTNPSDTVSADATAVKIQADGKIIVGGVASIIDIANPSGLPQFALARYDTSGNLDTSFGATSPIPGTVTTNTFGTVNEASSITGLAIQFDGKIVAVGGSVITTKFTLRDNLVLVRYLTNGSLDSTFGPVSSTVPGIVITYSFATGTAADIANSVALQADGKIVISGVAEIATTPVVQFALARYLSTTPPTPPSPTCFSSFVEALIAKYRINI